MAPHGAILPILEGVFSVVEDLMVCLPDVLAEKRDHFIPCLVVKGQKVDSKLIVDELGHCLTVVVLFSRLWTMDIVLDSLRDCGDPILDRCHALLTQE